MKIGWNKNETFKNRIVDIHDSLVLKEDGSVYGIFEIPAATISSVDTKGKEKQKVTVNQALENLQKRQTFEISVIPFDSEIEKRYLSLAEDLSDDTFDFAEYVLTNSVDRLNNELGRPYNYRFFISVPLKNAFLSPDLKLVVKTSLNRARDEVLSWFAREVEFDTNWYEQYLGLLDEIERDIAPLRPDALTTLENLFLQRLHYLQGTNYDSKKEKLSLQNSVHYIDESKVFILKNGLFALATDNGYRFGKSLPISNFPDVMDYLNFLEITQSFNFPVQTDYKVKFSEMKGVLSPLGQVQRSKKRLKNTVDEADEQGSNQKNSVLKSKVVLDDVEQKVDDKKPFVQFLTSLTITGDSVEEVLEKEKVLTQSLATLEVEISGALADQENLFYQNRLTENEVGKDKNFLQIMTLEAFCENLFFTTNQVGNEIGFYIGRIDNQIESFNGDINRAVRSSNKLIFYNLFLANKLGIKGKKTNNGHFAIIGETGSGKSFLTKLLFTYHSLLKCQILYIDPKAEMRRQYMKVLKEYESQGIYPEICSYIRTLNFVTLNAKEKANHGVLDPLVFLKGNDCRDLAENMVAQLLGTRYDNVKFNNAFLKAMDFFMTKREAGKQVGMLHVFEYLQKNDNEEVRDIAELASTLVQNSILSLAFSHGENQAVNMENRLTILEVSGLELPKEGDNITKQQIKSLVIMYALGYYCAEFGRRDKKVESIVFFDEAWFFNSTDIGRQILKTMKRVGRSQNNFLGYITQSVRDIQTEDDTTGFGTVFAFLEETEIDEVRKYMKIPITEETEKQMMNMTMGQCIMKDPFGHVERISIDGQFPEVFKLFDTVESDLKSTRGQDIEGVA